MQRGRESAHCIWRNETGAYAAPEPCARGVPPLDSALRKYNHVKYRFFRTKRWDTKIDAQCINKQRERKTGHENKRNDPRAERNHKKLAKEKARFLSRHIFMVSRMPASGGRQCRPARGADNRLCLIGKLSVDKVLPIRSRVQGRRPWWGCGAQSPATFSFAS